MSMKNLNYQKGGSHYQKYKIQPAEYSTINDLKWPHGNVVKYVTRYKDKAGFEDLTKADQCLNLIMENEYPAEYEQFLKDKYEWLKKYFENKPKNIIDNWPKWKRDIANNNHENENAWIQTYTGKQFNVFNPDINQINIEDIAHALSNICRFTGHCNQFYSVAQHCVIMSNIIPISNRSALLHDATEAYLCDIPRPIKKTNEFKFYKEIENKIESLIQTKFNVIINGNGEVKKYDTLLMVTEARQLGLMTEKWEHYNIEPLNITIKPLSPKQAEKAFLKRYNELFNA